MREHLLASKGTVLHTAKDHSSICMCVHAHVCVCCIRRKKHHLANQKLTFCFKTNAGNIMGVSHCGSFYFQLHKFRGFNWGTVVTVQ
jgi:hypothetical protein